MDAPLKLVRRLAVALDERGIHCCRQPSPVPDDELSFLVSASDRAGLAGLLDELGF